MSHKKRITVEVDPQIATIALGMARVMLHMKFIEQSMLPEKDRMFNEEQMDEIGSTMTEIYNKCMDASGLREQMANDPEGLAEMEREMEKSGLFEALHLS